ncbi:MAG: hypothetical protein IJY04_07955, partial [Clostridia bacterium]|nr:hypothetical protein [Clostridia bacterium]
MKKKTTNVRNSTLPRSLVIICSIVLLTVLCAVSIYAAEFTYGVYFEIDKNPIESVEIAAMDKDGGEAPSEIKRGAQISLSALVYPLNARETVISKKYKIIEGSDYAAVKRGVLTVSDDAPIGSVIEVIAEVDDVVSENSLVFTVARTPVEQITLLNTETSIMVGASLKLETEVFPADATDKNVRYSIVSDTPCMRMSYSGVLSFGASSVPEEVIAVTVRASSASDPTVYVDKTFAVTRPILEIKDATAQLSELNQQCAYSFNTRLPYLAEIFGSSAVNYSLDVDESVASVDINGLLFVSEYAPIGTEINLTVTSVDGETTHCQRMIVAPVFATDFAPVMLGQPDIVFPEGGYYLPGSVIEFDVVAFAPINVTEENKVFALRVSDDSLAYVEGNKVIIRNTAEISARDPKLTVTVYSQPNGLEKDFEINIFIPVEGVTATAKKDQLVEKHSYKLSDILGYTTTPANASVRSVTYGAEGLDSSVGVIRDGVLIIDDELPEGVITVRFFVEVDGIRSDIVSFTVY